MRDKLHSLLKILRVGKVNEKVCQNFGLLFGFGLFGFGLLASWQKHNYEMMHCKITKYVIRY